MAETRTYEIKFNFDAEEPQELSVAQGELIRAPANSELSSEPWTLVETVAPPFSRGFVPTSYLIPVDEPDVASSRSLPDTQELKPSYQEYSPGKDYVPIRRLSDPRVPHHLLEALSVNPPEEHLPAHPNETALTRIPPASQEYQHLFSQHDRQFQQVMHSRHEQFKSLEDAAGDLRRRIEASKQKSQEIATNMLDITALLDGERKRWKEKLAEEMSAYREI